MSLIFDAKRSLGEDLINGSMPATPGERYYGADAVSIEIRSRHGSKRVMLVDLGAITTLTPAELSRVLVKALDFVN